MRFDKHLLLTFCLLCGGFSTIFAQTCPRANPVVVNTTANTGQTLSWAVGCINSNTALTQINVNVGSGIIRVTANLPIAPIRRSNAVINGNGAVIDGSQVTTSNGLQIDAQNVSINGFTIQNFSGAAGIRINTGNDASITGNTLINNLYGVMVARSVANGDITNNFIGVNGTTSAGNSGAGVFFEALVSNPTTPPNVSNNTIANNGVGVDANNTRNVLISNNTMFCNITSGINRSTNIAAPVITSAGTTVVKGTATPGALVEVYAVDNGNCIRVACQGRTYLGKAVVATNGQWTLFTTGLKVGQNATATQTISSVNTSEFANCVAAVNLCSNINAAIIKTDVLCNGGATGAATVLVGGASSPLRLAWSNGATTASISNLRIGNYDVSITDGNNCTVNPSTTINEPPVLGLSLQATDETYLGKGDGSVSSNVTGGVAPYSYLWNTGAVTSSISNLKPGNYSLTITDDKRCTTKQTITVKAVDCNGFSASSTVKKKACNGIADGQAMVNATNGVEPYLFQWSNQRSGVSFTDLAAGEYIVTATDARGCVAKTTVLIPQATALGAKINAINPLCFGDSTGLAIALVSGGDKPYQFLWSDGSKNDTLFKLPIGTYRVVVTDSSFCSTSLSATLTQPKALSLTIKTTNETQVGKGDGTATPTVTGGVPPYKYKWSNDAVTPKLTGLKTGTYTLIVIDSNRCAISQTIRISSINCDGFIASTVLNKRACTGVSDGQATVSATGGVAPYVFQWSNQRSGTGFKDLAAGVYVVTATDSRGCTAIATVTIPTASALNLQITGSNPACFGAKTGQALGIVSGGNAPYRYLWSTNATTNSITQLGIGTYTLAVTDSNACEVKNSVTLSQPAAISINLTGTGETQLGKGDGTATSAVAGGVPPYQYRWSNNTSLANATGLKSGTYSLTVTDANQCTGVQTVVIGSVSCTGFSASAVVNKRVCSGLNDGQVTVNATGGVAPYVFQWSNQRSGASFKDLAAGDYTITVSDSKGCSTVVNVKVPVARLLSVQMAGVNPACFGASTGQVSANVSGGNAPYQFAWSNGATTTSISQLPAGVYNLAVTDSNRCVVNGSATLTQPSELKISFTTTNESQPGKKDGTITSAIIGGVSPFQVVWSNGATGANINNLASGNYSVTVTDAKGCQVKGSATVGGAACSGFAVSATATKGSCSGANDGKAEANTTGGVAPFVFQWSNGKTGSKQDNLKPGLYQVTATDGKGCVAGASVTILASLRTPRPAYGLIAPDSVCSKSTLTLSVDDLWPNPANVRYIWELPTGDSVITNTRELRIPNASSKNAGDYFVARDSAGCVSSAFGPVIVTVLGVTNGAGIAGRDTTLCTNNGTITLKASLPPKSKGLWIALDGGSISNPTALNPTIGNFKTGANRFVWSLDLGKCAALFADTVTVFLEQKPVLEDDYYQIAKVQDIAAMNVLLNDNIEGVQEIKLSILNPPTIGNLEFVPSTRSYRYTAPNEFRGAVEFKYIVCNAKAKCTTACDTAGVRVDVFNLPTPTDGLIIEDPGLNGQLIIHGLPGFTQVGIDIFNRWGDLVYRNADYDNGTPWKGTQGSNGKFLPPGAYYYVLKAFDGDQQVGKPQTGVIHLFTKKEN